MPSLRTTGGDFLFKASVCGKEEFGENIVGNECTTYILANTAFDIDIEVCCYTTSEDFVPPPSVLIEIYVDNVLRNVVVPKTGRGLDYLQFAEANIDRGLVMTNVGELVMQHFRFVDLDIDDAILNSRVVEGAGTIKVSVVHENLTCELGHRPNYELPKAGNDYGAISMYENELNNVVGIRFDENKYGLADSKHIKCQTAGDLMFSLGQGRGRKAIATFTFIYGAADLLNHFRVIPASHKLFDDEMEKRRNSPDGVCFSYRARGGEFHLSHDIIPFSQLGYLSSIEDAYDDGGYEQDTDDDEQDEEMEDDELDDLFMETGRDLETTPEPKTEVDISPVTPMKQNTAEMALLTPPATIRREETPSL